MNSRPAWWKSLQKLQSCALCDLVYPGEMFDDSGGASAVGSAGCERGTVTQANGDG